MIRSYVTVNGKITQTDGITKNSWSRLTQPTAKEVSDIANELDVDVTDVSASLDRDEGSRIEYDGENTIIIVDIPYRNDSLDSSPYNTLPFAIISTDEEVITVCQIDSPIIDKFVNTTSADLNDKMEFILKMMYVISTEYQQYLRNINIRRREIEKNLDQSSKNRDIIELHHLESSLVYFVTSLRACNVVLDKIRRRNESNLDKEHLDLLHDVIVENEQAMEMSTTYRQIIDGTRDLFVAVTNNKLNDMMRWLTAITIILSIPMILGGIYGMNVELPILGTSMDFWYLILGTLLVCACLAICLKKKQLL